jgi:hypothetical protein
MSQRHLLKATAKQGQSLAACGLRNPHVYTFAPGDVSCLKCRGSIYMADLEYRLTTPQQPKRRARKRSSN